MVVYLMNMNEDNILLILMVKILNDIKDSSNS